MGRRGQWEDDVAFIGVAEFAWPEDLSRARSDSQTRQAQSERNMSRAKLARRHEGFRVQRVMSERLRKAVAAVAALKLSLLSNELLDIDETPGGAASGGQAVPPGARP